MRTGQLTFIQFLTKSHRLISLNNLKKTFFSATLPSYYIPSQIPQNTTFLLALLTVLFFSLSAFLLLPAYSHTPPSLLKFTISLLLTLSHVLWWYQALLFSWKNWLQGGRVHAKHNEFPAAGMHEGWTCSRQKFFPTFSAKCWKPYITPLRLCPCLASKKT